MTDHAVDGMLGGAGPVLLAADDTGLRTAAALVDPPRHCTDAAPVLPSA